MSDDINPPETEQTPETSEQLKNELDGLRTLFEEEWNKATAEAEGEPPIQSLEYAPEEPEEPEEETEQTGDTDARDKKEKKEKKPKKAGKAVLIVLVILLVLILIPLIAYFVLSIKVPSLNNFMSAYFNAAAAKEPTEQIEYLESALGYCEEGTFLESMRQSIHENIAVATCAANGYAAARNYIDTNFTEEMLAKPGEKEFKELLAVSDKDRKSVV